MILRLWRRDGRDKPEEIEVASAWPYGEWLAYRVPSRPGTTHYIPGSAVWEAEVEEQAADPDPMQTRPRVPDPHHPRPIMGS